MLSEDVRLRRFFFALLLMVVLVFQMSVLPDTFQLKGMGRILNISALAIFSTFSVLGLAALFQGRIAGADWFLVIAIMLVLIGYLLNFIRNFGVDHLGTAGMLLPWTAAMSVPFMRSFSLEKCWALFYRFMLGFCLVALVEYVAVYRGWLIPTPIVTQNGLFIRGIATIFTAGDDGTIFPRMYGILQEPGTLAMFLMPAIAYALVFAKRLALVVFLTCVLAAQSLGGYASLVVLVALFVYWRARRRTTGLLIAPVVIAAAAYFLAGYFLAAYSEKGMSATTREEQVELFGENLFDLLREYPLGMPLVAGSTTNLDIIPLYSGSNFALFVAFHLGGVLAFVGYTVVIVLSSITSIKYFARHNPDKTMACAFISLPTLVMFVFQRATIFDSALFAFLFVLPVMVVLREHVTGSMAARMTWSRAGSQVRVGDGQWAGRRVV